MHITVLYTGPLAEIAGTKRESLVLPEAACLRDLIDHLGDLHGPRLWRAFYSETREFRPRLSVTRNGAPLEDEEAPHRRRSVL